MFWFVLSLKSLIAAISQSSVSLALVAPNRGCGTLLLVPRVWLWMLGKDCAPSGRASWSVLANDGALYDCLLDSMARVQLVGDKAVCLCW